METDPEKIIARGPEVIEKIILGDESEMKGRAIPSNNGFELYLTILDEISIAEAVQIFDDTENTKKITYIFSALMIDREPQTYEGYTALRSMEKSGDGVKITLEKPISE